MHTFDWKKNPRADKCEDCGTAVPQGQVILYDLDSGRPLCKPCSDKEFKWGCEMVGITVEEGMKYCTNPEDL